MGSQKFKTVYFPKDRTRSGRTARITISIPAPNERTGVTNEFISFVRRLSSKELRVAIGNPFLEDLEQAARQEGRTLSNYCARLLKRSYSQSVTSEGLFRPVQTKLPIFVQPELQTDTRLSSLLQGVGLTFRENKLRPIHRWYPYVEGFSANYVRRTLLSMGANLHSVYDPFGGCGTTQLEASMLGIPSFYSEINPFLAFVSDVKVNGASKARQNIETVEDIFSEYTKILASSEFVGYAENISLDSYHRAFPRRDYFVEKDLRELISARDYASRIAEEAHFACDLLLLAVASIAVACSNMTRRADLRRRRSDEYKNRVVNVAASLDAKLTEILEDLEQVDRIFAHSRKVSSDAKIVPPEYTGSFDLALTSPPYLNGTNYFRNTKLELWLLDFIKSEKELRNFTAHAICSGINNVSKARGEFRTFESVEKVAQVLEDCAYDPRIPKLVRGYFTDMYEVLLSVYNCLREGACFILDLGDSKFCGVHVPTDSLLCELAEDLGYEVVNNRVLAKRYSYDKTSLRQVEIILRKPKGAYHARLAGTAYQRSKKSLPENLRESIERFRRELPYKKRPYSKRGWGHSLHSLCSYQGKLKPSIAYWLVFQFSEPGMVILDPLGGVGTIALEACLQGRRSITNDLNPLAYTVASAKVSPPTLKEADEGIRELEKQLTDTVLHREDWESAKFGLNATVEDYFHKKTLSEVLKVRKYYLKKKELTPVDCFLKASLLHVLHGNRPYALSRKSHPITPFYPSGPFHYKSLIQKVRKRFHRVLSKPLPLNFKKGISFNLDFRQLPTVLSEPVDRIITSPPFIGLRFDRPNWMRLWFCGWTERDFHSASQAFLERQQMASMDVYSEFFSTCHKLLEDDGLLIIHIGASDKYDMASSLVEQSSQTFSLMDIATESVESIEKHGIRDKGATTFHQFMFLKKR